MSGATPGVKQCIGVISKSRLQVSAHSYMHDLLQYGHLFFFFCRFLLCGGVYITLFYERCFVIVADTEIILQIMLCPLPHSPGTAAVANN